MDGSNVAVFGVQPPDIVSLEDLCPPKQCPTCPEQQYTKCTEPEFSLFDIIYRWEVRQYGEPRERYPGYPNRTLGNIQNLFYQFVIAFLIDCELYAVGKPVYHGFINQSYGSWMRDLNPTEEDAERFWVTSEKEPYKLFQFDSKASFRKNEPTR